MARQVDEAKVEGAKVAVVLAAVARLGPAAVARLGPATGAAAWAGAALAAVIEVAVPMVEAAWEVMRVAEVVMEKKVGDEAATGMMASVEFAREEAAK